MESSSACSSLRYSLVVNGNLTSIVFIWVFFLCKLFICHKSRAIYHRSWALVARVFTGLLMQPKPPPHLRNIWFPRFAGFTCGGRGNVFIFMLNSWTRDNPIGHRCTPVGFSADWWILVRNAYIGVISAQVCWSSIILRCMYSHAHPLAVLGRSETALHMWCLQRHGLGWWSCFMLRIIRKPHVTAVKSRRLQNRIHRPKRNFFFFFSAGDWKCKIDRPFNFKLSFSPSLDLRTVAVSSALLIHCHFINHISWRNSAL